MKKFLFLGLIFSLLASCSNDEDLITTNQDSLFTLTSENALNICGGNSRILENENEEIKIFKLSLAEIKKINESKSIQNVLTKISIYEYLKKFKKSINAY